MILGIPELTAHPSSVDQYYIYYNTSDDKIYIRTNAVDPATWEEIDTGASIREATRIGHTLARVKYAGRDYGTFQDEILAFIKEQYGDSFNDFAISQLAIMIVQYVSFGLDTLSWYLDKQVEENFITTARLRSSVNRFAKLLGYKPGPMVNASVDLEIILDKNYGFDITIPAGEKLNAPNGLIYELNQDVTFTAAEQAGASYPYTKTTFLLGQNISAYEGETKTEFFTSDGTANQIFKLTTVPDDKYIAMESVTVTVDGAEWTENDFLEFDQTDQYMVDYAADPQTIVFGNGAIGNIPSDGAEIKVTYIAGSGINGSVAAETITSFKNSITVNLQTIGLTTNNPLASSGASAEESLASIKANAPKYFATADRAVSRSDYITLSEKYSHGVYGAIEKANATRLLGVENEAGIQSGLAAINQATANLSNFLSIINTQNTNIRSYSSAINTETADSKIKTAAIRTLLTTISADVTNIKNHLADAKLDLDEAEIVANAIPFQEILGQGDGTTVAFSKTLTFAPVAKSLFITVNPSVIKTSNIGDCDTSAGYLIVATAGFFTSGHVSNAVKIGGVKRKIVEYIDENTIRYSGTRIFGDDLIIEIYGDAVYGADNGAGAITGPGVSTGSINYTTAALAITFNIAPEGISSAYGENIYINYQYINQSIITAMADAELDLDEAETDADQVVTDSGSISTELDNIDINMDDIDTNCTGITTASNTSDTYVTYALVIPTNVATAVTSLEDYLDEVISDQCKVNIIKILILAVDVSGFYTAPSNGLISALKDHLDTRATATVTVSVVSGISSLLNVDVAVKVKVKEAFTAATVLNEVSTQVDNVLKGRDFGDALRLDEFNQAIRDNVVTLAGETKYEYVNVSIANVEFADSYVTDTPPSVNSDGDLEILEEQIVTKGSGTSVTLVVD